MLGSDSPLGKTTGELLKFSEPEGASHQANISDRTSHMILE